MGDTVDALIEKVRAMLEKGDDDATQLRTGIQGMAPIIKSESGAQPGGTPEISSILSKIKFGQITKLRKFEKGENFSTFCERFHEYVEIAQIVDDNMHLYFLQHVDDGTYSTLKLVNLNEDEKRNCALFCEKYKKAVYGAEQVPLKNELLECKQSISEDITDFSHRLREKAAIAFATEESIDENCLLALMRGLRDGEIRRKLNESSVTSFSEALILAKKLEKISNMFNNELKLTTPILKNSDVSFAAVGDTLQEGAQSTFNSSRRRAKSRHDSIESGRSNRSQSPQQDRHDSHQSRRSYRSPSPWQDRRDRSQSRRAYRSPSPWQDSCDRSQSRRSYRPPSPWQDRSDRMRSNRPQFSWRVAGPERRRCWTCNRIGHLKRNCYARNSASNPSKERPARTLN